MRCLDHHRRLFLTCLAAWVALAAPATGPLLGAEITIVLSGEEAPYVAARDAASKALASQGHAVQVLQLRDLTKAATDRKADVFLAIGTKAALALHEAVKPPARLVYCMVPDPARSGLAQGLPACGISMEVPFEVQVDLMLKAVEKAKTIGMLYRSDVPASLAMMKELEQCAPKGVRVLGVSVDKHPSVAAAIDALLDQKPDIIWTAPDAAVYDTAAIRALLLASVRRQVPVYGFSVPFVKAGALLGTGIDPRAQGEQAAGLVPDLLKAPAAPAASADSSGATPVASSQSASAHVVMPPKFEIAVNLVVAQRLSLTLPEGVIAKATQVFRPDEDKQ
jgi:ABC-type uncharacterized transport system substrate-binding protein